VHSRLHVGHFDDRMASYRAETWLCRPPDRAHQAQIPSGWYSFGGHTCVGVRTTMSAHLLGHFLAALFDSTGREWNMIALTAAPPSRRGHRWPGRERPTRNGTCSRNSLGCMRRRRSTGGQSLVDPGLGHRVAAASSGSCNPGSYPARCRTSWGVCARTSRCRTR